MRSSPRLRRGERNASPTGLSFLPSRVVRSARELLRRAGRRGLIPIARQVGVLVFASIAANAAAARAQAFIDFPIGTKTPRAITGGPDGNVWFANYIGYSIGRMTPQGNFTNFPTPTGVSTDVGIALGPDGNLWFTEWIQSKIGRITPDGVITEFPTPGSESP